jgi:CRAL/TRIO domain
MGCGRRNMNFLNLFSLLSHNVIIIPPSLFFFLSLQLFVLFFTFCTPFISPTIVCIFPLVHFFSFLTRPVPLTDTLIHYNDTSKSVSTYLFFHPPPPVPHFSFSSLYCPYFPSSYFESYRADRMSVKSGSGQFIAVFDLAGFTWSTCPSISMIKDTIGLLKKHYPYRLGGIFILNGGTAFNFVWNLLKPIMPKRALLKTFVLNKKEEFSVLDHHLGSRRAW